MKREKKNILTDTSTASTEMPEMKFEGQDYPNIPIGFPDPNGHWKYSRETVLVEFNPYTFLEAIDRWFARAKNEED